MYCCCCCSAYIMSISVCYESRPKGGGRRGTSFAFPSKVIVQWESVSKWAPGTPAGTSSYSMPPDAHPRCCDANEWKLIFQRAANGLNFGTVDIYIVLSEKFTWLKFIKMHEWKEVTIILVEANRANAFCSYKFSKIFLHNNKLRTEVFLNFMFRWTLKTNALIF